MSEVLAAFLGSPRLRHRSSYQFHLGLIRSNRCYPVDGRLAAEFHQLQPLRQV